MGITLIVIYITICFCGIRFYKKDASTIYYLIGFILILIAGLRSYEDYLDAENYIELFNHIPDKYEPSIVLIVEFIHKFLDSDPFWLFFIYAVIGISIKCFAIRRLTNLFLFSLAIYISYFYILHDLIQIRGGIASGLFLISFKYIENKSLIKFLIILLVAIFFHYSAIIILPIYFLFNCKKFNKKVWASIIPISYLLFFIGLTFTKILDIVPIEQFQLIWGLYKLRMDAGIGMEINVFNATQILRCCIVYFLLYYSDIIVENNKYFIILIKVYIVSISSFVLLAQVPDLSFRISQFYGIVEIILIPFIIYPFKKRKHGSFFPLAIGAILLLLNIYYVKLVP